MDKVAIIGCGPAGVAASVYLKRIGVDFDVFEKNKVGGLLINANLVENYPGFINGISGEKLCKIFESQLKKWKIFPIYKEVISINKSKDGFEVKTKDNMFFYKKIIFATGTIPKKINIKNFEKYEGKTVFYNIIDMLPKVKKDNKVVIIGGGDAAFDYALNLSERNVNVEIFYRSNISKCIDILKKRVKENKNIIQHSNLKPIEILKNGQKTDILFVNSRENNIKKISADYILIACGRNPNDHLVKNLKNDKDLKLVGDVKSNNFRQISIAIGDAIKASMEIEKDMR